MKQATSPSKMLGKIFFHWTCIQNKYRKSPSPSTFPDYFSFESLVNPRYTHNSTRLMKTHFNIVPHFSSPEMNPLCYSQCMRKTFLLPIHSQKKMCTSLHVHPLLHGCFLQLVISALKKALVGSCHCVYKPTFTVKSVCPNMPC